MLDILIFDVGLGQCIFVYPQDQPEYGMMVDCGNTPEFEPIDLLIRANMVPADPEADFEPGPKHLLSNLTLTNYDHDHYSGLPYLRSRVKIHTARFSTNLSSAQIDAAKPDKTEALGELLDMKTKYRNPIANYTPPYLVETFALDIGEFQRDEEVCINDLSQMVFTKYGDAVFCFPGDLEKLGWEKMLSKPAVRNWLAATKVFVASHHGRENGYHAEVFRYCRPECVIISDKYIMHGTQEDMATIYDRHVQGDGVGVTGERELRKVLTTRSDGHIWITVSRLGQRAYGTF